MGFLGFTNSLQVDVARLADRTGMTWPIGIGLSARDMGRFGALDGAMALPGYELKPLLVVVDRRGQVIWTDGHARHRHQSPEETVQQLDQALSAALGQE